MSARLNIGLIGSGFMGQAHADAYRRAAMFYPDLPKRPHLYALADQDQSLAERHAAKLGAEKAYGDWRELVNDPQVDVVDITSPNHLHYTMAMAAIAAGKHVYCEKPLAVNEQQAQEMAQAARRAGVKTMVAFNNIKTPAALLAKQIIARGDIGEPVRFRGTFDQGFYNDPNLPWSWRCSKTLGGSGGAWRPWRPYPVGRPVFAGRDPRSDRQRAKPACASVRCRSAMPGMPAGSRPMPSGGK
ncbi:Myo-inositol 2-dehydrogenase [Klebsiella variicola]|uniref:Myo-inositol 2-dehydrogenase n=1 Tax=Klebsiella variicola TaxID=244366 RepID=A0A7H4MF05_KLEVA|nr:Myo-inositol 2-dehydrogenase [Klebsiella variicola]